MLLTLTEPGRKNFQNLGLNRVTFMLIEKGQFTANFMRKESDYGYIRLDNLKASAV